MTASGPCLTEDSRLVADGCCISSSQYKLHVKTMYAFIWVGSRESMSVTVSETLF